MEAITHDLPHSKLYSLWVYPMEAMTHDLPHSKLYSLWVDPMEAITHDLPHSKLHNLWVDPMEAMTHVHIVVILYVVSFQMNKYLYFTVIPSIECVDPGSVANASYTSRSWVIASIVTM
jgi:hypothetical protein